MKKFVICLLAVSLLLVGCEKQGENRTDGKKEQLEWGIAGVWGYETEDSVLEEEIRNLNQLLEKKEKTYQINFRFFSLTEGKLTKEDEEDLKKCDLITMANQLDITDGVKIYSNLKDYIEEEMFMPLDNLLKTQNGERIKEKMLTELTLETGNWEGTQWVLPTALPELIGSSLRIERKLYEKAGGKIDSVPDFVKCDELFEKLYLANEKQPFLTLSNRTSDYGINGIEAKLPLYIEQVLSYSGSTYYSDGLGIGSLKSEGNDLDTRNLLRTQYFEDVMKAWKRYSEKGYVNENMDEKALVELCNSYTPEIIFENAEGDYVIPMSRHYVLNMYKPLSGVKPFSGIGSGSTRQELAFEALTDFVEDLELNILIQGIGLEAKGPQNVSGFVFHSELSKEGEKEYCRVIESVPKFAMGHTFETFYISEIQSVNEVFKEYSTEIERDGKQNILATYFSEKGQVTEQSIHNGIASLNEKLETAGMKRLEDAIRKHKK